MGLSVNMLILNVNTECILLLCICEIQGCIRNYSTLLRNFLYLRTSCLRHNNNNNNIKDNFDIVIDVMDKILIFIMNLKSFVLKRRLMNELHLQTCSYLEQPVLASEELVKS